MYFLRQLNSCRKYIGTHKKNKIEQTMLWKITQNFLTTIVILYTGFHWGICAAPGVYLFLNIFQNTTNYSNFERAMLIGVSIGVGYVLWMLSTIFLTSILSFILSTVCVMALTYVIVSKMKKSNSPVEEYFTAGRSLSWPIIGGSLLLTNISTEQLVGLNGDVFGDKALVGIAWEVLAAFAMIATALIFLPRYLASGFTTTPAFLEKRFDKTTRSIVSGLFLFGYVSVLLPVVLYTGSLVLKGMFSLDVSLYIIVLIIGLLGGGYAIIGGLKTVAVSDTINGVGLLIGGLTGPILGLVELGDGSFFIGIDKLLNDQPKFLSVFAQTNIDHKIVSVPWPTLFTGMMFIQVFYWSTNQVIVQRAMAAKSLAEGQKGVLFASFMKLLGPFMLCLPGIIALHMEDAINISTQDQVYGSIVRNVLPSWTVGLFAAVLLGSILSSFNSALNSASTLFSLQF